MEVSKEKRGLQVVREMCLLWRERVRSRKRRQEARAREGRKEVRSREVVRSMVKMEEERSMVKMEGEKAGSQEVQQGREGAGTEDTEEEGQEEGQDIPVFNQEERRVSSLPESYPSNHSPIYPFTFSPILPFHLFTYSPIRPFTKLPVETRPAKNGVLFQRFCCGYGNHTFINHQKQKKL